MSGRRSLVKLKLLMAQRMDQGYFPDQAKSLFIANNLEEEEAARWEFEWEDLNLN